jgi:hypothetical protein
MTRIELSDISGDTIPIGIEDGQTLAYNLALGYFENATPSGGPGGPVDWDDVANKPTTFPPDAHNHDAAYSAINHHHNAAYAALVHNHDALYAALAHNHDGTYALRSHTHDSIGFTTGTGVGGTVTQLTSKATAVTLNKLCGRITMHNAALAAGAEVAFTVNNSTVANTDVVIVCVQSIGTANAYLVSVGAVGAGSFSITVSNASTGSLSQAVVLNFAVIKSVIN